MVERDFRDPDLWDSIAKEMGQLPAFLYDLGDDSHRLDVVQLVCEAIARIDGRIEP
jgi:hypothetical protein